MEKIIRFGISVIDFDPEGRRRPVDRSGVHAVRGDRRYVFFCGERSVRKRSERLRTKVSINRFDRRRRLLVRGVTMRIRGLRTVRTQNACGRPQRGFRFRRTCISPRPAFRRVAVCLTGWLFCRHYPTMPPDPSEIGSGKKLRNTLAAISLLFLASCGGNKDYYMFTSFHEPADEGLRYLYSEDGIHWDSIPGVWLKPELGQHQLMRDPSMVRTPDGTYHLVWTTSWKGDLGFGYAHSKDLIHWSEQQMIPVMADEPTTINVWAPEIFYDDESDQFMVVWASCIPGRFASRPATSSTLVMLVLLLRTLL